MNIYRPDHAAYDVTATWFDQTASSRSSGGRDDFFTVLDSQSASSSLSIDESARRADELEDKQRREDERARDARERDERAFGPSHRNGATESGKSEGREGPIICRFPFHESQRSGTEGTAGGEPTTGWICGTPGVSRQRQTPEIPETIQEAASTEEKPVLAKATSVEEVQEAQPDVALAEAADQVTTEQEYGDDKEVDALSPDHRSEHGRPETSSVESAKETNEEGPTGELFAEPTNAGGVKASESNTTESYKTDAERTETLASPSITSQVASTSKSSSQTVNGDAEGQSAGAIVGQVAPRTANTSGDIEPVDSERHDGRERRSSKKTDGESQLRPGEVDRTEQRDSLTRDAFRKQLAPANRDAGLNERAESGNSPTKTSPTEAKSNQPGTLNAAISSTSPTDGSLGAGLSAELTASVPGPGNSSAPATSQPSSTSIGAATTAETRGAAPDATTTTNARQREASVTDELRLNQADQRRLMQRVSSAFRTVGAGEGEIKLRLSPPHLGSMRLEVKVKDQAMHARLQTETEAARQVLTENLSVLRDRLAEQGIIVETFDIDVGPDGFDSSPDNSRDALPDQSRSSRGEGRGTDTSSSQTTDQASEAAAEVAGIDAKGHLNVVI